MSENELKMHAMSFGGAAFKPERVNIPVVEQFIEFCRRHTLAGDSIITVVGGGGSARNNIEDARALGVTHLPSLDRIGIDVTRLNANLLKQFLEANDVHVHLRRPGDRFYAATVHVQGGSDPGATSDLVTVEAANEAGIKIVHNVTSRDGIHPVVDGTLQTDTIIEYISFDEYLQMIPLRHTPGINVPFDTQAAMRARDYGMTVLVSGPDFNNIDNFLEGRRFRGTIIHP